MAKIETVEFPVRGKAITDPKIADLVDSLAPVMSEDEFKGDNEPLKTRAEAANLAQLLRRHVARKLGVPEKQVRSRLRDLSGKNDESNGKWVWGLKLRSNGDEPAEDADDTADATTNGS